MEDKKALNFTIVPADEPTISRVYSNFCAIQHSPFDFTLTFCEMMPLSEKEIQQAQSTQVVHAPVRAKIVVPIQMIPGLVAALQENFHLYQDSYGMPKGTLH
jgi:hypothetical protein